MFFSFQFANIVFKFTGLVFNDLSRPIKFILIPIMYLFKHIAFGYCVIPFVLLRWRRIKIIFASMYYIGTVLTVVFFIINLLAGLVLKAKRKSKARYPFLHSHCPRNTSLDYARKMLPRKGSWVINSFLFTSFTSYLRLGSSIVSWLHRKKFLLSVLTKIRLFIFSKRL